MRFCIDPIQKIGVLCVDTKPAETLVATSWRSQKHDCFMDGFMKWILFFFFLFPVFSSLYSQSNLSYPDKIYLQEHQYTEDARGVVVTLNGEKLHVSRLYQDQKGIFILEREMRSSPGKERSLSHHCPGVGCSCLECLSEWGDDRIPPEEW